MVRTSNRQIGGSGNIAFEGNDQIIRRPDVKRWHVGIWTRYGIHLKAPDMRVVCHFSGLTSICQITVTDTTTFGVAHQVHLIGTGLRKDGINEIIQSGKGKRVIAQAVVIKGKQTIL